MNKIFRATKRRHTVDQQVLAKAMSENQSVFDAIYRKTTQEKQAKALRKAIASETTRIDSPLGNDFSRIIESEAPTTPSNQFSLF